MRRDATYIAGLTLLAALLALGSVARAGECADPARALSVGRTVEIDAKSGPIFGTYTKQVREPSFLRPKEVVLTFDDGPLPAVTKSILDTLDKFCTKATFFSVGKMALAYPETVREVLARGHTLGSHTYTHPYNLGRMNAEKAKDEIERGMAAVATAAGIPVAPFFRFTGLADSAALLGYLQTREIATFSVDAVSNDSYITDKQRLVEHTLKEIGDAKGGIVLFHDIKPATAKALPEILSALKARGYSIVHMTSKRAAVPLSPLMSELAPKVSHASEKPVNKDALTLRGAIEPDNAANPKADNVTLIAPEPKDRTVVRAASKPQKQKLETVLKTAGTDHKPKAAAAATPSGWSAQVDEYQTEIAPPVFVTSDEAENAWDTQVKKPAHLPIIFRRAAR